MRRTYAVFILAILAFLVWIAQKTPLAFLNNDATGFVGGLCVGFAVGGAIAWWATRAGNVNP